MTQWWKRLILLLAVTSFASVTVSCYGSFGLTKKIYKWNGTLGNKFVGSLVFWILIVLPVYEVALVADYFVLNVIEFWTGNQLVALGETKIITKDGVTMELSSPRPGVLVIKSHDMIMEAHEGGAVIRDTQGNLVAELTPTEDGGATMSANQQVTTISPADLSALGELADQAMLGAPVQRQLVETARQISH
jgi:Domain of unknown function (DUF3332)